MKIKYEFNTGETTEVEVSEEIGAVVIDSRREEEAGDRKEHRHCLSLEAFAYEGAELGTPDFVEELLSGDDEQSERIRRAFSHLSTLQQRRLLMVARGMSIREISRREGKDFRTVHESIEAARKKFKKYF